MVDRAILSSTFGTFPPLKPVAVRKLSLRGPRRPTGLNVQGVNN